MSYNVKISWRKKPDEFFADKKYSRAHKWTFDYGLELPASSSPHVVRLPFSDENAVDPEEAFVAAVSSCHMLSFLYAAANKKYVIESYEDDAVGIMGKNDEGKLAITEVTLNTKITFSGNNIPSEQEIDELHHQAHEGCYIAASVKTKINIVSSFEIMENDSVIKKVENQLIIS
jgi:organic hydroperoxide reductase OsmC/OhrA